jgi:hypothetical protein
MRYAFLNYVLVTWICCSLLASAQEKKQERPHNHTYKIDVVLTESDGAKTVNSRTYTMLVNDGDAGRIRQGDRIPISVGGVIPGGKEAPVPNQIQYMDVGFSLDCRLRETDDGVFVGTVLDMSSLAPEQGASGNPIVRQQRYQTGSFVQPGKRTVIANVDELDSKRRLQIEALLTQVQ